MSISINICEESFPIKNNFFACNRYYLCMSSLDFILQGGLYFVLEWKDK